MNYITDNDRLDGSINENNKKIKDIENQISKLQTETWNLKHENRLLDEKRKTNHHEFSKIMNSNDGIAVIIKHMIDINVNQLMINDQGFHKSMFYEFAEFCGEILCKSQFVKLEYYHNVERDKEQQELDDHCDHFLYISEFTGHNFSIKNRNDIYQELIIHNDDLDKYFTNNNIKKHSITIIRERGNSIAPVEPVAYKMIVSIER